MTKPIGILGGTFDPVHCGHINLALECIRSIDLEIVRMIPVNIPPHREQPVARANQRLAMLNLACEDHENLVVDEMEIERNDISYTINTLKTIRKRGETGSICLIMGMDAFQSFNTWRDWRLILDYVHIIVADRPGSKNEIKEQEIKNLFDNHSTTEISVIHQLPSGRILKANIPLLDISASQVRFSISQENSVKHFLPEKVLAYINQEKLYKTV